MNAIVKLLKRLWSLYLSLIAYIKSTYYTKKITSGRGKIVFSHPSLKLRVKMGYNAKFKLEGVLSMDSHLGGREETIIIIGNNANLEILGDFSLGQNNRIYIADNANLIIKGKENSSGAGITSDTRIMVNKSIRIGADFICAWSVFITDSDWHMIEGQKYQKDVVIGDNVWIANSSSLLKGSVIGKGCVIASHTKLGNKTYPENCLIAGERGAIIKNAIHWERDIE